MSRLDSALTPSTLLLILGTVGLLSFGQVLFKHASVNVSLLDPRTFMSPVLIGAIAIYGVATLAWLAVLARVPLSLAFPFYGLGFVLVPLFAHLFLNEPLRWQVLVGGMIILLGVSVTSWRGQ